MQMLRANTAVDVLIGPFVDSTDGDTEETALTLSQADIKLSKNGQALAQKNDNTSAVHDANGYYNCELDATDTNTEGTLTLIVHESGALSIRHEFMVLSEAAYDSLFVAKDDGFMDVNIKTIGRADTQETEANNLESACANYSATRGLTGTALPAAAADAAGGLPISDAGGLDLDAKIGALTFTVAGDVDVNVQTWGGTAISTPPAVNATQISGSATAADNAEIVFATDFATNYSTTNDKWQVEANVLTIEGGDATDQINAACDAAIETYHLDHLLAVDYDPASKPGTGTALLNELVESDGGVSRFTTNALEQGPGGGSSNPFQIASGTIGSTGNTTTTLHLDGLTQGNDELNDCLIVVFDDSTGEYHSRWITDWVLSTELATVATLPFTPEDATDTYVVLGVRQDVTGGSGLDAAGVRAAIGLASANLDTQLSTIDSEIGTIDGNVDSILADTNELQGDWANGGRLDLIIDDILADTNELQSDDYPARFTGIEGATFNTSTDSLEALRNRGDSAWITATGFSTLDAAGVRTAVGMASADLDTQLDAILADTAEIGSAGAGLTEAGGTGDHLTAVPWNAAWSEEVADSVFDATASSYDTEGTIGLLLNIAGGVLLDTTITGTPTSTTFQLTEGGINDDFYNDKLIFIYAGSASSINQVRTVSDYTGATKTVTVDEAWTVTPVSGDRVVIQMSHVHPISQIADSIWDELTSGHTTSGTFGEQVKTDIDAILVDTNSLNDTKIPDTISLANINAEVDTALGDYDPPTKTEMDSAFTEIKGATWATTDTLEAIRDRGDAAWITATGFSTLDAAGVRTAVGLASANLDTQLATLPTAAEIRAEIDSNSTQLAAIVADTNELQGDWANGGRLDLLLDAVAADVASLDDTKIPDTLSLANINAQVVDALATDTYAEPTGAPAATAALSAKINYLYMALRNQVTVTASAKTFYDDSGNAEWSKVLSDDGTTYTEAEGS